MSERIYQVGERIRVTRRGHPTLARVVRAGPASMGAWDPNGAAFVLYVASRDGWTKHAQPLFASEIVAPPSPPEEP